MSRHALCNVLSGSCHSHPYEGSVSIGLQVFIELVELPQTSLVHVFIGHDTCLSTVGTIHQTQVITTRNDTIPCLSSLLEVANVLIADAEVIAQPCQTTIVRTRTSTRSVDISVCCGLVVGSIEDKMIEEQTCRKLHTSVIRIV